MTSAFLQATSPTFRRPSLLRATDTNEAQSYLAENYPAFASLVAEQHETVGGLAGLAEETAASLDESGDALAEASGRRAVFPRVFNAVVLALAALLLLLHAVHA